MDEEAAGLVEAGRKRGKKVRRPEPTPVQRALVLLTRREHSRTELTRKLLARGIGADEARQAIDALADAGWQDDARFAESLVRHRANNGYGPVRIRSELAIHGLGQDAVAAAMDSFEGDWQENARALVLRRYGAGLHERGICLKAGHLLIRRGFTTEQARLATCPGACDG